VKRLRVLLLTHPDMLPPESLKGRSEHDLNKWKTEIDIIATLRAGGHEVRPIGVRNELTPIREAIESWNPHVVFNLLEEFDGEAVYDQNVASLLEMMKIPFTGCNPRGLMLARRKDLSKKLLHFHRIAVPAFAVFPVGRKVRRPPKLALPLIVKSVSEDASLGISQASVVETDEKLAERVAFVHERIGTPAIAEQYIDGRELYVGVLGNHRRRVLPVWELEFAKLPPGSRAIATSRVKHNPDYQERLGVLQGPAEDLPVSLRVRMKATARRICRTLELDGYVRIDFRLGEDGVFYFIEANPNPEIASNEEFAQAALHDGLEYPDLLNRIMTLGIRRAGASTDDG